MKKFLAMLLVAVMLIGIVPFNASATPLPADKDLVWWYEVYGEYLTYDYMVSEQVQLLKDIVASGVDVYVDLVDHYSISGPADADYIYDGPDGQRFVSLTDTNEFVNELAEPSDDDYMISGAWFLENDAYWMSQDWDHGDKAIYIDRNTLPKEPEFIWWQDFYKDMIEAGFDRKWIVTEAMSQGVEFYVDIKNAGYMVPEEGDFWFEGPNGSVLINLTDTHEIYWENEYGSGTSNAAEIWAYSSYDLIWDEYYAPGLMYVNIHTLPASAIPVYEKVTDVSTLAEGDRILLTYVENDEAHVLGAYNSGNYRDKTTTNLKDGKIGLEKAMTVLQLTVDEDGYFTLHDGSFVLFYDDNGNKVNTANSANIANSDKWTFVDNGDGTVAVTNVAFPERELQYNASSNGLRFACYKGTQKDLVIYKYNPESILPPESPAVYKLTGEKLETLTAGQQIYLAANDNKLMGALDGYACKGFDAVKMGNMLGYQGSPMALTVGGDAENGYSFQRADGKYLAAVSSGYYTDVVFVDEGADHLLWVITEEGYLENKTLLSGESPVYLQVYSNGSFAVDTMPAYTALSPIDFYAVGGENGASTLLPGMSVTLSSILDLKFRIEGDLTDYTMEAIIGGRTVEATVEGGVFVAPLKVSQMSETITAVLKYKGEAVLAFQDTVAAYINRLGYYYADDAELLALCDSLLVYGEYAAKFVAGTASAGEISLTKPLDASLKGYDLMIDDFEDPTMACDKRLVLTEAVTLQIHINDFWTSSDKTGFRYGYSIDGDLENIKDTSTLTGNVWSLELISVQNWDKACTLDVWSWNGRDGVWNTNGWSETTVSYSPMSYIYEQLTRTEGEELAPGLDDLLTAMANYWMAAEAYIAANA